MKDLQELEELLTCLDSHDAIPLTRDQTELWQQRLSEGQPALPDEDFPVEAAAGLLAFLVQRQENINLESLPPESIVTAYLSGEGNGWENTGISKERGALYTHLSCQQALAKTADKISGAVSLANWTGKICPICGSTPFLSYLGKEAGTRMLVCGACLTEWRFKRIGCACCDETQPEKLQTLTTDELPGWSIFACRSCNGFLKTLDLRQIAVKPDWRQATLSTLNLDYAAQKWLATNQPA